MVISLTTGVGWGSDKLIREWLLPRTGNGTIEGSVDTTGGKEVAETGGVEKTNTPSLKKRRSKHDVKLEDNDDGDLSNAPRVAERGTETYTLMDADLFGDRDMDTRHIVSGPISTVSVSIFKRKTLMDTEFGRMDT
ncbi:hypothetical protein PIB30_035224 [Stylosanthes scabra]|uniref:Uncharacterized protein n=1 Tax=Stylosanthes scabra TaxID=79078 RepID=A0ABU6TCT5_9FABA|nr:hypothetical protein [Stylosanthes scabra]